MASGTNRRINIFVNGKEVEDKIGGVQAAFSRLNREIKQCSVGSDDYNKKAAEIKKLKSILTEHSAAIGQTATAWDKMKANIITTGVGVLAGNILTTLSTAAAGFFGGMIKGASDLSDQFADIRKTTGMTEEEVQTLNKSLKKIDTRTAVSELRNIAIVAGQLGIEKEKVAGFTDAVDKINVALGDEIVGGAEVVASTVGKLRNVLTDMKSDAVDQDLLKIGNALNELGAAGFATAPVVANLSNRIGSIGIPLGLTSAQVMGLAATFQELNISEERGGTAMGRILKKMTTDTQSFAKIAGIDIQSFTKLVNTDLYAAFIKVVEGSRKGGTSATALSAIIKDLEVDGAGASEVFMKLSANVGMTNEKVSLAGKALQSTDSVMNEFNLKNNNFAGVMAKAGKDINGFFMGIGQKISPVIAAIVVGFADFTKWLKRNAESLLFLSKIIGVTVVSYVSYTAAAKLATWWTTKNTESTLLNTIATKAKALAETASIAVTQLFAAAQMLLAGNIVGATQAMRVFNATLSTSGIGLIVGVVSAAAAAYMMFKSKTEEASEAQQKIKSAILEATSPIMQEQAGINLLIKSITSLNEGSTERKRLLDLLVENYPDFLGKLSKENVTNSQLSEQLKMVNEQYKQKIMLAATAAEREEITKRAVDNQRDLIKALERLDELNANAKSNSDPMMGKVYENQIANMQMVISVSNSIAKNLEERTKKLDLLTSDIMAKMNIKPKEDRKNNGGEYTAPETTDTKAMESFEKEMKKLREERLQSLMEANEKELRQVDVKYEELIVKARENLKEINANDKISDADKITETQKTNAALLELDQMWSDEIMQVHQNQFAKRSELENKDAEEYIAEIKKNTEEERKLLEDKLKEAAVLKSNAIKEDYIKGLITKKQYEDSIENADIAQLKLLIELRKKYNLDVLDLETELANKLVTQLDGDKKESGKKDFFEKLFNTDKAREKFEAITEMISGIGSIWGNLLQAQSNSEQTQFNGFKKSQDKKKSLLDKQLKSGLISQQQYDEKVAVIDAETEQRQKKMAYDQAKRQKTLSIFEIITSTAVAVMQTLAKGLGFFSLPLAAIVAAMGATQLAVAVSAPLPELAEGGYTDGISIAGEKGREWVASNNLLKDQKTAPVISWLENYQRGNKTYAMPTIPNFQGMQNAINSKYQSTNSGPGIHINTENQERLLMLMIEHQKINIEETRTLNKYLSNPDNRKARIVRDELTRFDKELNTLQGLARIGK
ncbi:MAG: phage tail tape measure protein [Bacteroidota bacterium]